ncbi:MAG: hypothetical protein JNK82_41140 [Myxococcaceae bacterium]|nr:hypothetical protein [Myxococcaceae bacterium]
MLALALVVSLTAAAEGEALGPQQVYVGVYMHHVPEIDLKTSTYLADFFIWFRWKGPHDPTQTLEWTNLADASALTRTFIFADESGGSKPVELPDGSLHQQIHIQGRFTHPFSIERYPFDEQEIVFEIEDNQLQVGELVYVPDPVGKSALHPGFALAGWEVGDLTLAVSQARYDTNFGDLRVKANEQTFAHLTAKLHVKRPIWSSLVKTIVPILIVLLITLVVFLIDGKYFDARMGLGITTLISAVALQLTSSASLPDVGYVVLLDKIYNVSYFIIFVALLESVVAVRLVDQEQSARAQRIDRTTLALSLLLSLGAGVWLVLSR